MALTKQQILEHALTLDPKERDELIEELRQVGGTADLTDVQRAELRRRVEAMSRGDAQLLDGEQVMREMRERMLRR